MSVPLRAREITLCTIALARISGRGQAMRESAWPGEGKKAGYGCMRLRLFNLLKSHT
jgi:hypothetical protein